ncbi:MAG: hypothetical protein AABX08_02630 [Nanoarchaeota archaeon]
MIKILRCLHCRHEWARRRNKDPVLCPRCKSRNWNKPPQIKFRPARYMRALL